MVARRAKKPPAQGGWNLPHLVHRRHDDAGRVAGLGGAGEKAWFGWPTIRAGEAARASGRARPTPPSARRSPSRSRWSPTTRCPTSRGASSWSPAPSARTCRACWPVRRHPALEHLPSSSERRVWSRDAWPSRPAPRATREVVMIPDAVASRVIDAVRAGPRPACPLGRRSAAAPPSWPPLEAEAVSSSAPLSPDRHHQPARPRDGSRRVLQEDLRRRGHRGARDRVGARPRQRLRTLARQRGEEAGHPPQPPRRRSRRGALLVTTALQRRRARRLRVGPGLWT